MTTDYVKREAFVKADPSYQLLEQTAREATLAADALRSETVQLTYRLQRLLHARDVLLEKMWESEDVGEETDALLQKHTCNSSDCWFGMLSQASDEITDLVCQLCSEVAQKDTERLEKKAEAKTGWRVASEKGDELRTVWNAQEKEAAK